MGKNFDAIAEYSATWECDVCGKWTKTSGHYYTDILHNRKIDLYADLPDGWGILYSSNNEPVNEVYCDECGLFTSDGAEYVE